MYRLSNPVRHGRMRGLVSRRATNAVQDVEGSISDQPARPDTNLVTPLLTNLSADQRKIIALCETPQKQEYLMRETSPSHRTLYRRKSLEPLIQAGLIRMTRPDEPNHGGLTVLLRRIGVP